MQPGAASNQGPSQADHVRPGVVFGYRTRGDWGSYSDGEGAVYYFGRTKQKAALDLDVNAANAVENQKELLRNKMRRVGLNAPSRMLLWVHVSDIDKYWDEFKQQLRGYWMRVDGTQPLITNQLCLGDHFFTVANMGVEDFGTWCKASMNKLLNPPRVYRIDVEV